MYTHTNIYMYVYVCIYTQTYVHIPAHTMHSSTHVCVHTYTGKHIHIHMHIYIHIRTYCTCRTFCLLGRSGYLQRKLLITPLGGQTLGCQYFWSRVERSCEPRDLGCKLQINSLLSTVCKPALSCTLCLT